MKKLVLSTAALALTLSSCSSSLPPVSSGESVPSARQFKMTIEAPATAIGPLSPGVVIIHKNDQPIFVPGEKDRGLGLEGIAEDGDPTKLGAALEGAQVFNIPVGKTAAGPALPNEKYEVSFSASPGDRVSFATMYVQSNDGFYAFESGGLSLFSGTTPVTGDVTNKVTLWDAGTEVNAEPAKGANQAPRQSGPNVGDSEDEVIKKIGERDEFTYPIGVRVILEAN